MFHVKHSTFVDMLCYIPESCGIMFFDFQHNINI